MCRIPSWLHPSRPSRPTPASSCRLAHRLSANRDHFPPPRHPDPDWTWCTPGIDLAWLGLAALTWFGPKLLAWPRHPAPRPPSAPTGGGGGFPSSSISSYTPSSRSSPPPPPPSLHADKGSAKGKPLNATQARPTARSSEVRVQAVHNVSDFQAVSETEKKEKYSLRTWQPMPLVPHPMPRAAHLNAEQLHNVWTSCCITTEEAMIIKECNFVATK